MLFALSSGSGQVDDAVDVSIVRFSAEWKKCRSVNNETIASDITNIDVVVGGQVSNVSGLSNPVEFVISTLPPAFALATWSSIDVRF